MKINTDMKITSEVYRVGGGDLTASGDAAIYLINSDGHAALIDAGCGRRARIKPARSERTRQPEAPGR